MIVSIVEQIYFQQTSCITVDLLQYYFVVVDFVVILQGIATFFEDILFFRARDCIVTLLFLERTCFYFFTRLNKKTNVVWDISIVAQIYSYFLQRFCITEVLLFISRLTYIVVRLHIVAFEVYLPFKYSMDIQTSILSGTCIAIVRGLVKQQLFGVVGRIYLVNDLRLF